ncbi:Uncharacterized protein BM_BM13412, partial [Brugia malayi]
VNSRIAEESERAYFVSKVRLFFLSSLNISNSIICLSNKSTNKCMNLRNLNKYCSRNHFRNFKLWQLSLEGKFFGRLKYWRVDISLEIKL